MQNANIKNYVQLPGKFKNNTLTAGIELAIVIGLISIFMYISVLSIIHH